MWLSLKEEVNGRIVKSFGPQTSNCWHVSAADSVRCNLPIIVELISF